MFIPFFLQIFNPQSTPWFKENPFWGGIEGFFTFLLSGLGFAMAGHPTIGRWLIALAWPWAMFSLWIVIDGLVRNRKVRIATRAVVCAVISIAGLSVDSWVRPTPSPRTEMLRRSGAGWEDK